LSSASVSSARLIIRPALIEQTARLRHELFCARDITWIGCQKK